MNVLVTGGDGFIGRYVCEKLENRGHHPLVFDHHDRGDGSSPFFLGDMLDATAVTEAMAHADGWIHLAAVLGTQETIQNPRPAAEANIMGGLNMLEAAAQYDTPGVYIGVGNHWMNNTYSISKTTVERFVDMFNRYRNTRVNVVRAMNAYGPRQEAAAPFGPTRVRKITPSFVCRALTGMDIEVYGHGRQVSDMVYVTDVATALVNALEHAADGDVFHRAVEVGPKVNNTVLDVAELAVELAESGSRIVFLPMRPGELPDATVVADTETLKLVDMDPDDFVPLREGMARTVDYFRDQLHS